MDSPVIVVLNRVLTFLSTAPKVSTMRFEAYIREKRNELNLSLRATAQGAGVDVAYLSRVESGKVPPSEPLIGGLAAVLQCSTEELQLLAGRLPDSIRTVVEREPSRMARILKQAASSALAEAAAPYATHGPDRTAIEDGFPFEEVSTVAEIESWRKEVHRPIYHVHKWWAQRLGSVFRAAIIGAAVPAGASVMDAFYSRTRFPGLVVFDPFMGSGTTVGEAHKLGATAVGRDINPVACAAVRGALGPIDRRDLLASYAALEAKIGDELRSLYRSIDRDGNECDVLYFFWVKILACPSCARDVDLFSSYEFARHAYAAKNPAVQVLCPACGAVFGSLSHAPETECPECRHRFDQNYGPARHATAVCPHCQNEFPIARVARSADGPPRHRLYAKLVLRQNGAKEYLRATAEDVRQYEAAEQRLLRENLTVPQVAIQPGNNTKQILNYGYRYWHQLFNARQLLGLATLRNAILSLPAGASRDVLLLLFSGTLEFNNMFASYKGEGTGAVRHMFAHHILKPERTPIEANLWGTPRSSGAFSTLFRSRLLRAIEYRESPFEIAPDERGTGGHKVFGLSDPIGGVVEKQCADPRQAPGGLFVTCGSSAHTDMVDGCVDLVVTDPPFFDNVHYSELADFFHVWQTLGAPESDSATTRNKEEVQDTSATAFADKLAAVFAECHRVLRNEGLLVFSYHHSRPEGWSSVASAVVRAGFTFVQSQPVKAEMSVAAPKAQAKQPIDIDVMLVCRKRSHDVRCRISIDQAVEQLASIGVRSGLRMWCANMCR
ncbi:MAG: helix-turn-helix domain-containing protein, partial [Phycisphaerae bacterium]|nr:helix-turn-helix domain-containing protein [Phycisphaerae bacterium]